MPNFATLVAGVQSAKPLPGNQATESDLKAAAAATLAAGDLIARWYVNTSGSGVGLRGGSFTYGAQTGLIRYTLNAIQWTTDMSLSGAIDWHFDTGSVRANLQISGPGTSGGSLTATWLDRQPHSMADISGQIGGRKLLATMYAP